MVAPTAFTFNEQTAQDNSFMHSAESGASFANAGVSALFGLNLVLCRVRGFTN